MLLARKNNHNLTQHRPSSLLYTKINQTYSPKGSLRVESTHESGVLPNNTKVTTHQERNTYDPSAPKRRVVFQQVNVEPKMMTSLKKIKLIINNKPEYPAAAPPRLNVFRSLDSSFISQSDNKQSIASKRSIKTSNPELSECKRLTEDILMKLSVFEDSKFCPKQLTGWIVDYFNRQKSLISKIFLKIRTKKNSLKTLPPQLIKDKQQLFSKLETKIKDNMGCSYFATSQQLSLFSAFLQKLYVEKAKIKLKEVEDCLTDKMKQICKSITKKEGNCLKGTRQKPVEVMNFMCDLSQFEAEVGSMNKIRTINRNRFKLVNDTDMVFNKTVVQLKKEVDLRS